MKKHFFDLFIPHHRNNHRAKLLHHKSLSKLILILLFSQFVITAITQTKPGILGFASDISVQDIVNLTNSQRQKNGVGQLKFSDTLADSARRKAADMFANNYWAHTSPSGISPWEFFRQAGYNYLYAGENLARDFNDSNEVVKAWMKSPTHKDNIVSGKYSEIGVAVVNGVLDGQETTLVVQHFGKTSENVASIPTESASHIQGTKIQPEIAYQEEAEHVIKKYQETLQNNNPRQVQIIETSRYQPIFSAFDLTKSINFALTLIIIIALAVDGYLIYRKKQQRRVGKNFVHLALFVIVMLIILLTNNGRII